tara:strand:+ start:64 stop:195 length:132 start_codon:yes stop_codon:yes gene_type:complete
MTTAAGIKTNKRLVKGIAVMDSFMAGYRDMILWIMIVLRWSDG